jgi:hypothetical protein
MMSRLPSLSDDAGVLVQRHALLKRPPAYPRRLLQPGKLRLAMRSAASRMA